MKYKKQPFKPSSLPAPVPAPNSEAGSARKKDISVVELDALQSGKSLVESFKRGQGALVFRKVGETTTGYYRYWKGNNSYLIQIAIYKQSRVKEAGWSLKQIREKAQELAALRQAIAPDDLKEHLERTEQEKVQARIEEQRLAEVEASHGTLKDLCDSYVASLERRNSTGARNVKNLLYCYCLTPFPVMAEKKARNVTTDDMVAVIRRMIEKDITTTCNRVRSYLHAAFEHGMRADNDPFMQSVHGKRFSIPFNPVAGIPRQAQFESVRERRLSDQEIRDMWLMFGKVGVSRRNPLYGLLLKFCLACYGNRPQQLIRCRWSDYDEYQRTLVFVDSKGKKAVPKKRIIPLSGLAVNLLEEIREVSGSYEWIFSITGKNPIAVSTLGHAVHGYQEWLKARAEEEGSSSPERWTAKDLRTTATSLLTRLRIPKEQRYLLQSREDGSIESKHYDHDDRIPEKRDAAKIYDNYLVKILNDKVPVKLVDMGQYRKDKGM